MANVWATNLLGSVYGRFPLNYAYLPAKIQNSWNTPTTAIINVTVVNRPGLNPFNWTATKTQAMHDPDNANRWWVWPDRAYSGYFDTH